MRWDYLNKCYREEIDRNWARGLRVESLKIAVAAAETLVDDCTGSFYPTQCFLVYELLESFGRHVRQRLRTDRNVVLDLAQNWLYKVISIRGFIPF